MDKKWLQNRRQTTSTFILMNISLGIEQSITFASLFIYLKDVLHVSGNRLTTFYSAISGIYFLSQIISSLALTRIFDKYRRLKLTFFIVNNFTIAGNALYTLPYSPWCLLAGRLISGVAGCIKPIMVSELTRSFPKDELLPQISRFAFAFSVGFTLGPFVNFVFLKADFQFLGIPITYANGAGLLITFLFILMQILTVFFVTDLSREFDLKKSHKESQILEKERLLETQSLNEKEKIDLDLGNSGFDSKEELTLIEDTSDGQPCQPTLDLDNENHDDVSAPMLPREPDKSIQNSLWTLFTSIDVVLIFIFSFFVFFELITYDSWIPMLCTEILHWGIVEINLIFLGNGIAVGIIYLACYFRPPAKEQFYTQAVYSFVAGVCLYAVFLYFSLGIEITWLNVLLWFVYIFLVAVMIVLERLFLMNTLVQMVPSEIQAFTEGIRLSFSRTGAAIGLFTAAFSFGILFYFCAVCMLVTMVLLALLIWRKKHFQNPKMINFYKIV
eukprot:TCONS_00048385-protein